MSKEKARKSGQSASASAVTALSDTQHEGIGDGAFMNLREKIEARLQNKTKKTPKNLNIKSKPPATPRVNVKPEKPQPDRRGKKRSANGVVLERPVPSPATGANDTQTKSNDTTEIEDELEREVRALGGTGEDLDLIAGADSESEVEGTDTAPAKAASGRDTGKRSDKPLEKGILNILKEIALAQGNADGVDEPDEENAQEPGAETQQAPKQDAITKSAPEAVVKTQTPREKKAGLKCDVRPDWFNQPGPKVDLEAIPHHKINEQTLSQLQAHARALLDEENERYKTLPQTSSSQYQTFISSGTLSDKISALTLAVMESPVHNIKALEALIGLARKRSRAQAVDVLKALKDLFAQETLLPGDRKLYVFGTQPALLAILGKVGSWKVGADLPNGIDEQHLIVWAFESWLKEQYFEILKILENWCNDEIEFSKSRAVSYVYELLREKPEQEANLLRLLVNKLGDPVKKISSQTSYLLMQLLGAHPAMKMTVVSAIESDIIFRPGQSMHGKYYAALTLNQTALSSREEDVAVKLLDIYFGLFTGLLKPQQAEQKTESQDNDKSKPRQKNTDKNVESGQAQQEEVREKLTSAILTGINRAYPYSGSDRANFTQHLDTLFKITHSSNFNTSVQAMMLIQQLSSNHQASSDRFYRVLYESLLDPRLVHASKQQLYLNLLHRSLKADLNAKRVKAFAKRILQMLSLHEAAFICGAFFLIRDLESTFPSLTALIDQSEDHEDDVEVFQDVDEHATAQTGPNGAATDANAVASNVYDAHKRAPEHANADNTCAWELLPFLAHFHPSVAVNADHVLRHAKLSGKPDLSLHTLIHFLDRFVYRNAKLSTSNLRGSSIMQPMATDDTHAVLISSSTGGKRALPVNSEEFRTRKSEDIAAEDVFFHNYFTKMGKDATKKKAKKGKEIDDEEGEEDAIWKAMIDSAPDLEGEGSEDEDLDMSDLESHMEDEDEVGAEDAEEGEGDDESVDIEAGIFDESDDGLMDMEMEGAVDDQEADDFAGLESGEEEEEEEAPAPKKSKTKAEENKKDKERRKKMKSLPTFASAADYAKMLADDDDEDLA